jgi:hypothetical protein
LKVARAWSLTPAQWRAQSMDDRALMMAYDMFTSTCEQYAAEWYTQRSKGKEQPVAGGTNPYKEMCRKMGI